MVFSGLSPCPISVRNIGNLKSRKHNSNVKSRAKIEASISLGFSLCEWVSSISGVGGEHGSGVRCERVGVVRQEEWQEQAQE